MYAEILSTALNSKERLLKLLQYPADIFDSWQYKTIIENLQELSKTESEIDLSVLVTRLKSVDEYKKVESVVADIIKSDTTVNFDYQISQLVQNSRIRELKLAKIEFIKGQVTEEEVNQKCDGIRQKYTTDDDISCVMSDFLNNDFNTIFPPDNFVPWKLQSFNDALIGMFKGNLILIAGEPGVGKTTFVNGEARVGRPLYFNLEITRAETYAKYLQEETGIHVKKIISNMHLSVEDMDKINKAKERLKEELTFKMYDRQNDDFNFIISKIKYELMTGNYDKIIIDNLQRVRNIGEGEAGMANLTGTLKQLAKDFQIPIIGISHLIKTAYTTMGRPTLGTLKGGGSLIQDADCVIFIYKDENGKAIFDCQKDRFGSPGKIQGVGFDPVFARYVDIEYRFQDCHKPRGLGWGNE